MSRVPRVLPRGPVPTQPLAPCICRVHLHQAESKLEYPLHICAHSGWAATERQRVDVAATLINAGASLEAGGGGRSSYSPIALYRATRRWRTPVVTKIIHMIEREGSEVREAADGLLPPPHLDAEQRRLLDYIVDVDAAFGWRVDRAQLEGVVVVEVRDGAAPQVVKEPRVEQFVRRRVRRRQGSADRHVAAPVGRCEGARRGHEHGRNESVEPVHHDRLGVWRVVLGPVRRRRGSRQSCELSQRDLDFDATIVARV